MERDTARCGEDERAARSSAYLYTSQCFRAAVAIGVVGLLLFNAIGLARIEAEMEAQIVALEAASNARLTVLERKLGVSTAPPAPAPSARAASTSFFASWQQEAPTLNVPAAPPPCDRPGRRRRDRRRPGCGC